MRRGCGPWIGCRAGDPSGGSGRHARLVPFLSAAAAARSRRGRRPVGGADHLRLRGRWRLADQRESSHWFLFGHRFWADVRAAVAAARRHRRCAGQPRPGGADPGHRARSREGRSAWIRRGWSASPPWRCGRCSRWGCPSRLPVSPAVVQSSAARASIPTVWSPGRQRSSRRWFGFLKGGPRQWAVTFDERPPAQSFPLIASQHLTTAAALDARDYRRVIHAAPRARSRCNAAPAPAARAGSASCQVRSISRRSTARAHDHRRARLPAERRAAARHPACRAWRRRMDRSRSPSRPGMARSARASRARRRTHRMAAHDS